MSSGFFYLNTERMKFLENDLEEIIYKTYTEGDKTNLLEASGLPISGTIKRQLKIGNYGIADLVTFERCCNEFYDDKMYFYPYMRITVYELKKDNIGISAFLQATRYVKGLKKWFKNRGVNYDIIFKIVLIGRTIDLKSSFIYLTDLLPESRYYNKFLECYTYTYNIDGLKFKEERDYSLINEGFEYER